MSNIMAMQVHVLKARSMIFYVIPASIGPCQLQSLVIMKPYRADGKTKVIHLYLETKSAVAAQRRFQRFFKTPNAPSRSIILSSEEVSGP